MKRLGFLLAIIFFALKGQGQNLPDNFNLIPNSGLEFNTTGTPVNDTDFIDNPICWAKANKWAFPFITNSSSTSFPHNGNAYGGIITAYPRYIPNNNQWYDTGYALRTYYQTKLLQPLIAGKKYYFSIYVGAQKTVTHDILGNIGAYFSTQKVSDFNNDGRINVMPQIRFTTWNIPLFNSFYWKKLTGSFTATGGESFLTIGNFDLSSQFNLVHLSDSTISRGYSENYFNNVFFDDLLLVADTTTSAITLNHFSLGNDTLICSGRPVTIGGEGNFFNYLWSTGATTRFITVNSPGKYWCRVDYGCGMYSDTIEISSPLPPMQFNLTDTVICSGRVLTVNAPIASNNYSWSNGATGPSITLNSPGVYWLRIGNLCNQTYTDTFRVRSMTSVVPGININTVPPLSFCEGTPITFITNDVAGGDNPLYQWYKNGLPVPGATLPTYQDRTLLDHDTLTVALFSSLSCPLVQPTLSNKVGVHVLPVLMPKVFISANPGTDITLGQPVTFSAGTYNAGVIASFVWLLNGQPQPFANDSVWSSANLRAGDVVQVRLESSELCAQPAQVYSNSLTMINNPTAIATINNKETAFSIYPNPAKDYIEVNFEAAGNGGSFTLFNCFGSIVVTNKILYLKNNVIKISQLPAGIYVYRLIINGHSFIGRISKN